MRTSLNKNPENKSQSATNIHPGTPLASHIIDNRPEAVQLRRLKNLIKSTLPVHQLKIVKDKLNVVGENHVESDLDNRREVERKIASSDAGGDYWEENEFNTKGWFPSYGDDPDLRARHRLATVRDVAEYFIRDYGKYDSKKDKSQDDHDRMYFNVDTIIDMADQARIEVGRSTDPVVIDALPFAKELAGLMQIMKNHQQKGVALALSQKVLNAIEDYRVKIIKFIGNKTTDQISAERSAYMAKIASGRKGKKFRGIWKVGDSHTSDIVANKKIPQSEYELTSRKDFNDDYPDLPRLKE